jgi:hypothetical protein
MILWFYGCSQQRNKIQQLSKMPCLPYAVPDVLIGKNQQGGIKKKKQAKDKRDRLHEHLQIRILKNAVNKQYRNR